MQLKTIFPKVSFILVMLLASGCFSANPLASPTATPSPTVRPSNTPSPSQQATATPMATATKTPTLTPTITWTPRPTLPAAEARQLVQTLLTTNGGCELPCWWGLTPGQTRGAEVEAYLKTFALSLDAFAWEDRPLRSYWAYFPITTSTRWQDNLSATFYVTANDDVLDLIVVDTGKSANEILADYGPPAEVWVFSPGIPPIGQPEYELTLVYPERGILASYSGIAHLAAPGQGDILNICPDHLARGSSGYFLWPPTRPRSVPEMFSLRAENVYDKRIEEVSNLNVTQFYEAFLRPTGNPPICLETPIKNIDVR